MLQLQGRMKRLSNRERRRIRQFSSEAAGREERTGNMLNINMHARRTVLPDIDLGRMGGREIRIWEAKVSLVVCVTVY